MTPILLVFLLQLTIHLINTIGKQTINDIAWTLFTKLPTNHSHTAAEVSRLRRDVIRLDRELRATSAQDEFAKWAKLRRQHDKAKEKHEILSREQASFHSTFNTAITVMRFMATQGLNFGCNFYYAKQAMFYLPQGWVPWHVEWLLSFPRAPVGGVSINVWGLACSGVIGLVMEGLIALWTLGAKEGRKDAEKVAMKMEGKDEEKVGVKTRSARRSGKVDRGGEKEKKEL